MLLGNGYLLENVSLSNFLPSFDEYFIMQPWSFQTQKAGSNFSSDVLL
jgi:hypothetical protein